MEKNKNEIRIGWKLGAFLGTLILIITAIVSASVVSYNCRSKQCGDEYAGVCFDEDSILYQCNVEEETCSLKDWDAANMMKHMEEESIVIYGSSRCGWCKKQVEEFGSLGEHLSNKGLYIDCYDSKNKDVCADVRGTPTWKINGEIVSSGYMKLEDIPSIA